MLYTYEKKHDITQELKRVSNNKLFRQSIILSITKKGNYTPPTSNCSKYTWMLSYKKDLELCVKNLNELTFFILFFFSCFFSSVNLKRLL